MESTANKKGKSVIFLYSYHHMNTQKIGNVIAEKLSAELITVNDKIKADDYKNCDLYGFGAGIDSGKHYRQILEFAGKFPAVQKKRAFIFSTSGIYSEKKMAKDHKALRDILLKKGFVIIGEFSCRGFNTNSVLKIFGGMNKGHPDNVDLKNAETFIEKLIQ